MKRITMFLAGCLAIGVAYNTGLAQNDPAKPRVSAEADVQKPGQDQKHSHKKAPQAGHLAHASRVLDMTLRDPQGKEIGEVEDVIIDSQGRVAYVIVSFEKDFVAGGKLHAVPPQALCPGSDPDRKDLILSTTRDKFTATSGFTKDQYPQFDEQSIRDTYRRFDQTPYWEGRMEDRDARGKRDDVRDNPQRAAQDAGRDRDVATGQRSDDDRRREFGQVPQFDRQHGWTNRASEIIGKKVVNNSDDSLGSVKDLIIDALQHRVVYVVLTDGGLLGIGETLTPTPYSALKAAGEKEQFTLDATKDSFEAISFKGNAWPDMTNRQWAQRVHAQFNQDPYWAGDGSADADDVDRHRRREQPGG